MRQIKAGALDTSSLKTATEQARQLRQELENIKPPSAGSGGPGGFLGGQIDGAINQLKSLALGYIGIQGVVAGISKAIDLAELDTQSRRANKSFEILSKGADLARTNIYAIQTAAGGATTSLQAINVGAQAASLGLAKTASGFADLARASRIIATVSPIIKDQGEALTQLALFASNAASYARADQLGLAAGEVRDRIEELRKTYGNLDDSQLKLMASMQLLEQKFGSLLNSTESQATGLEKLRAAYGELQIAIAGAGAAGFVQNAAGDIASAFNQLTVRIQGTDAPLSVLINNLKRAAEEAKAIQDADPLTGLLPNKIMGFELVSDPANIDKVRKALDEAIQGVQNKIPGSEQYLADLTKIAVEVDNANAATDEQINQVRRLQAAYQSMLQYGTAAAQRQTAAAQVRATEEARQATIYEQQANIESALASRAQKAAPTIGVEAAIAEYKKQRDAAKQAIDELVQSGVSNAGEIAINVNAIVAELTKPFDELEARAKQGISVDFGAFGDAFASLNQGFADFLPGVSSAREELAQLSEELAFTGTMTAEQAAQFDYLASVAYAVGDSGSQLNAVVSELGGQFLESNAYAAELVNQLFLTEAAFRNGQISAGQYAGMTAALTGNLLTLAQGAGIATNAVYALNAAQSDMSNLAGYGGGFAVGGSISERIATQQAASGREQNRREMERYNRDMARAQERSAAKAGKLLEDGAKKANDELKKSLDSVPGLFGTTQVTEQDMNDSKLGIYQEKADEYLRRLKDEVKNGKDWEGVSIEEARAGLERAGLEVGATAEQTLALLERAMNDSSLYSAIENIPIFINEEAVERYKELQKKSEEGRKHVYEFFGVQIDEATEAATSGGGAAPVAPPKLVDIDPLTEGLQTGLDEYVNANGQTIKEQVANAKGLFFDPANLFGTGGKTGTMGPMPNPTITVTADPTVQALTPYITGQQQATVQMQASGATFGPQLQAPSQGITLTPAIDATALQTEIDKLTPTVGVQLHVTVEEITLFKQTVAGIVSPSVSVGLKTSTEDLTTWSAGIEKDATSPNVEARINTTVGMLSDWMLAVEKNAPQPNVGVLLHTTVEEIALFKQTIAGIVTPEVQVSLALAESESSVSTQLVTAITADIAANATAFATPGAVVAQLIMAAILANMQGGQQQAGGQAPGAGGPIAMAMVTNLATQFSTNANMFYATGLIPAQNVEAGFKGYQYSGMADNLQAQINAAIASKAGEFITVGGYIGGWISQGLNQSFNAEINLSFASNAGSAWATAFMKGAISTIGGGALLQSISDKVITDLATELEK